MLEDEVKRIVKNIKHYPRNSKDQLIWHKRLMKIQWRTIQKKRQNSFILI